MSKQMKPIAFLKPIQPQFVLPICLQWRNYVPEHRSPQPRMPV